MSVEYRRTDGDRGRGGDMEEGGQQCRKIITGYVYQLMFIRYKGKGEKRSKRKNCSGDKEGDEGGQNKGT